jgi:hypothetical protein
MTDNNEEVLRKSLKAVDRSRNWLLIGLGLAVAFLYLAMSRVAHDIHGPMSDGLLLHSIFVVLAGWTATLTILVVIHITFMTKRVLRAIELASRK